MALAVVAIGGNSLVLDGQKGTIPEQFENAGTTSKHLADIIERGWDMVLTHGNGPQVGNILLRVEKAADEVYPLPLDICDADTEGGMGYMFQQVFGNELRSRKIDRTVITMVTQVEVDPADEAFQNPTKFIGPFFGADEVAAKESERGWVMKEDSNRGWRRVVPSPQPIRIVEFDAIKTALDAGLLPIAVGGGGVPVSSKDGILTGVEAVIDKDLASALLASELGAEILLISTGVEKVSINFGKENQKDLGNITLKELETYVAEGHFPAGSMGPKVQAAIKFLKAGGAKVIITNPDNLGLAVDGKAGTHITA